MWRGLLRGVASARCSALSSFCETTTVAHLAVLTEGHLVVDDDVEVILVHCERLLEGGRVAAGRRS